MSQIKYIDEDATFTIERPENYTGLYFPLAGENGLKSSITPNLGGDSKMDQTSFLLEPVSIENLHNNRSTRNFWVISRSLASGKKDIWSATGASAEAENNRFTENQDDSSVTAGFMWHELLRKSKKYGLSAEIRSFIPIHENVEVMQVNIKNDSGEAKEITGIAAIPVYGRSADNIRDHRNVTGMLHRIRATENGVIVKPTMSFDERGHKRNNISYFVYGCTGSGDKPIEFFPTVENFIGEGMTFTHPAAVYFNENGVAAGVEEDGREAFGGIKYKPVILNSGYSATFIVLLGIASEAYEIDETFRKLDSATKIDKEFYDLKKYWNEKVNVNLHSGNKDFDLFMHWVCFEPYLRKIFGCSFLPHHDYGRGGRGWRDLWQDCLSLAIMNPGEIHDQIRANFAGVRADGTNATIIGEKPGEFKADRNGIARVWMDHGFWPFVTVMLYINETGDYNCLLENAPYFKDSQAGRGLFTDEKWTVGDGTGLKTKDGEIYEGSLLEHILLENLTAFYDVGEHGNLLLHGADWNDALDMAAEKGESVAFTYAYAWNIAELAKLCKKLVEYGIKEVPVFEELRILTAEDKNNYASVSAKRATLKKYCETVKSSVFGKMAVIGLSDLSKILTSMAESMTDHLRKNEWITDCEGYSWFNGYYDNNGRRVEGDNDLGVRMMLTGEVFAIMSGIADAERAKKITESADWYLFDKEAGGYRLNTDFHEVKMDMGRQFGFAYGEKENGSVFSHMDVMYANALYKQGFVKEGYKVIDTLTSHAIDFKRSRIYPGIPEYFRNDGRGVYHYLTGAASWLMLTMVTEVYGVKGIYGDLCLEPKLLSSQFDSEDKAYIDLIFAGKRLHIIYVNHGKKDYGDYSISAVGCDGINMEALTGKSIIIPRQKILSLSGDKRHDITAILD